jgi:curved DNA-binding protein CbpA
MPIYRPTVTPYEVLGVKPTASDAEIRRAYVALARRFHPDTNPAGEERMRAVNEAWAVLGDRQRRRDYDRVAPDPGFVPDDPGDDGFDPRAQPDVPYRPHSARELQRQGTLTLLPVAIFGGSVVSGTAGVFFDSPPLFGMAVILFVVAVVGLIVVLLIAMVNASRDEG